MKVLLVRIMDGPEGEIAKGGGSVKLEKAKCEMSDLLVQGNIGFKREEIRSRRSRRTRIMEEDKMPDGFGYVVGVCKKERVRVRASSEC